MKLNSNWKTVVTIPFDTTKFIPSPAYGVERFLLDRIGTELARATTIVKYSPNSKFPKHTHIGGEEFIVLDGTFHDEHGSYPVGTYVRNPIGTSHAPWVNNDGCTIFVKLLQMSVSGEVPQPYYINTNKQDDNEQDDATDAKTTTIFENGVRCMHLFTNEITGERVDMLWIEPNHIIPIHPTTNGGEELLIVDGSLLLPKPLIRIQQEQPDEQEQQQQQQEIDTTTKNIEYTKWGWLRFPPNSNNNNNNDSNDESDNDSSDCSEIIQQYRQLLRSGSNGVQLYRKIGHLTAHALSMEKILITE